MTIYYIIYVCGEDSDEAFSENHPIFFADFDSAQRHIEAANEDCEERFGQFVGPFRVPSHDDLTKHHPFGTYGRKVV